ncbi:MAG: hypothetical protein R3C26_00485 [Calditrichia bacterium]
MALRVRYSPMESVYGQFAAFRCGFRQSSNPRGAQIHRFNSTDGLLLTGEIGSINSGEAFGESYQKIAIGGWRYTADFASIDETSSSNNNMGIYLLGERQLFGNILIRHRSLSCFANVGFANSTPTIKSVCFTAPALFTAVFFRGAMRMLWA